jgi:cobalt-zinc-cadmium efflux system outer membrane protein
VFISVCYIRATRRTARGIAGLLLLVPALASSADAPETPRPLPASAAELGIVEAGAMALARQPLLEGLLAQTRAAEHAAVAAAQLPDPQLVTALADLPVNGADAGSLRRDSDTQLQVGVMQEFTRAGKRRLKAEAQRREGARWLAEHHLAERTLRRDAQLAWLEAWRYERTHELLQAQQREAETQASAVAIALKAGAASQADLIAARLETGKLEDEVAAAEQNLQHARNALSRWIGADAWRPLARDLPAARPAPAIEALLQSARRHPHLSGLQAQRAAADTEAALARAAYAPDWRLEVAYGERLEFSDMVTVRAGIDLPLFTRKRQDPRLAAALARRDASDATLADAWRQLESEVRLNLDDLQRLRQRLRGYEQRLLPQARQRIDAALGGWRAGRSALAQVLEARREALELQRMQLDLLLDAARHDVQLEYFGAYDSASPVAERDATSAAGNAETRHE